MTPDDILGFKILLLLIVSLSLNLTAVSVVIIYWATKTAERQRPPDREVKQ